jgi:hypothetical protein
VLCSTQVQIRRAARKFSGPLGGPGFSPAVAKLL